MFLLNLQSKVPINIQIQEQILKFIQAGVLKPGDKLPSVRQLASENGINPNTVARAYTELEKNGYVYNPDDTSNIAHGIIRILSDNDLREKMANDAVKRITKHDISYTLTRIEEIYNMVLDKHEKHIT
jgi:DNA-binding transcriptional regulator YhcF (GntR family)